MKSEEKIDGKTENSVITMVDSSQRKDELKKLIEEDGIFSINYSDLARNYGVSHTQIRRDVESLMSEMEPVNWVAILNKSQHELEHTIKVVSKAMESASDPKMKGNLAGQLSEMVLRKTSLMERMDRLLPANMKPEPVTIVYRCTNILASKKSDLTEKNPSIEGIQKADC